MSNKFIPIDRESVFILPPALAGWLPENSLARFVVEIVEQLDTSRIEGAYRGGGSAPYPPKMMLGLLCYCYATGIFSSRLIERATYELIPVIYLTGNTHPDHNSINSFRLRFLPELKEVFVQILLIAHGLGVLKLGEISLDGSKFQANASKHKAMSWEYANKLEAHLQKEVERLLELAGEADSQRTTDIDIGQEWLRRDERLRQIAAVKAELEARAQARYEQEQAEYEAKLAERQAKEEQRGRKLGGKKPKAPEPGPRDKDQVNFTDPDSRIMPSSGGKGFIQAYNAQAGVDMETLLILCNPLSQHPNDKQEVEPALAQLSQLPEELGELDRVAADSGYFSEANLKQFEAQGIVPYIACGRQPHYAPLEERLQAPPAPPPASDPVSDHATDSVSALLHRMHTDEGKRFYAKRKSTVEPVFGIIKHVMKFRQFLLRGLEKVKGEWDLVCIAYNLKRIHALIA